jgi:hypothetical protein
MIMLPKRDVQLGKTYHLDFKSPSARFKISRQSITLSSKKNKALGTEMSKNLLVNHYRVAWSQ